MTRPAIIAIAAASLGAAFVAGRYTKAPVETVRTVKVVEYREVKTAAEQVTRTITVDGPVRVVHRRFACPDGKPSEETVTEKAPTRTETAAASMVVTDVREHVVHDETLRMHTVVERDRWSVGASAGVGNVYGAELGLRLAGDLWVAGEVRTDMTAAVRLRYTF
jgi:hypothetical protein